MPSFSAATLLLIALALVIATSAWRRASRRNLPPGPQGSPVIGNLLQMPKSKPWRVYADWSRIYGDIIGLRIFGQTIIVLNSVKDVRELFQNRASNYSSRVSLTMVQLVGFGDGVTTCPAGERFRTMRRLMNKFLGAQGVKDCVDATDASVTAFLQRLVQQPGDLQGQLKRMTSSILLRVVYGYEVKTDDDEFMQLSEETIKIVLSVTNPGWLVDLLPILRFLPSWMPGASFKRSAKQWRKTVALSRQRPWNWTRRQVDAGTALPSFAAMLLSDQDRPQDDSLCSVVMTSLYAGGFDPMLSASSTLILALALHPEVQSKAQQEVDNVTGGGRLPTHDDRSRMPYTEALLKEVHRWQPVTNLALPHVASEDDEYKGFHIPQNAIVFPNVWNILHDAEKYPDPFAFTPDRFMETTHQRTSSGEMINEDPTRFAFGFGYRQCPGRLLADATLFLLAGKILAMLVVSDPVDEHGVALTPDTVDYTTGTISHPAPFSCNIKLRAERTQEAILLDGLPA